MKEAKLYLKGGEGFLMQRGMGALKDELTVLIPDTDQTPWSFVATQEVRTFSPAWKNNKV